MGKTAPSLGREKQNEFLSSMGRAWGRHAHQGSALLHMEKAGRKTRGKPGGMLLKVTQGYRPGCRTLKNTARKTPTCQTEGQRKDTVAEGVGVALGERGRGSSEG